MTEEEHTALHAAWPGIRKIMQRNALSLVDSAEDFHTAGAMVVAALKLIKSMDAEFGDVTTPIPRRVVSKLNSPTPE